MTPSLVSQSPSHNSVMSPNSVPPNTQTLDSSHQDPQNSPNKIPKTLNSTSPNKGKSKIEEDETSISCCGICLSEEGKSIRGYIDSCDHYFCFVCIMEWAKVESRCPICKRRFGAIRRPIKEGVFAAQRIVNVPERNQVCIIYCCRLVWLILINGFVCFRVV